MGKISGAVGTFAHVEPDVEEEACRLLGLEPAPVSTQIVQRDRHAEFMTDPGHRRRLAGEDRARDPLAAAHRDPRGGGAVRGGAEGLERHAPQAQPGLAASSLRARPPPAQQRAGRARERRPVARAGHQPLVGGAGDPAGLHASCCDYMLHQMTRILEGLLRLPGAHAREHGAELRAHVLPARAPRAHRQRAAAPGGLRAGPAARHARVAGAHGRSAISWPPTPT